MSNIFNMQMILKSERLKLTVIVSLISMLLISFSFSPVINAKAKGITSEELTTEQELDLFFSKAVYVDENGVEQIDFNQMEKLFGKEQTENVKAIKVSAEHAMQCDSPIQPKAAKTGTFSSCMKEALLDYFGVSEYKLC